MEDGTGLERVGRLEKLGALNWIGQSGNGVMSKCPEREGHFERGGDRGRWTLNFSLLFGLVQVNRVRTLPFAVHG